jgi:hypothetical protein
LQRKGVFKPIPRSPDKANAKLPRWLSQFVELFSAESQVVEEEPREIRRGAFSYANDAEFRAAHDAQVDLWNLALERDGRQQSGTAGTKDKDVLDHWGDSLTLHAWPEECQAGVR